ncbi:MAG UNVERIFIED_CONTAM: hypothetical protein LVQ98_07295 [Rickettsiaceae bacterium]
MIDAVISDYKDQRIKILELGIGSGCLLMTLLLEIPDSIGEGLDISAKALEHS